MIQNALVLLIGILICMGISFAVWMEAERNITSGQKAASDLKYVVNRLLLQHWENKDEND